MTAGQNSAISWGCSMPWLTPFYVWWLHSLLLWLPASVDLGRDRQLQKTTCSQWNSEMWESSLDGQLIGRHNKKTSLGEALVADKKEILWPELVGRERKPEKKNQQMSWLSTQPMLLVPTSHLLDFPICVVVLHCLQNTISNFPPHVLEKASWNCIFVIYW